MIVVALLVGCDRREDTQAPPEERTATTGQTSQHAASPYAGSAACAECHATQQQAWHPSLHRLAMLPASGDAPLTAPVGGDGALAQRDDGTRIMRAQALGHPDDVRVEWALGHKHVEQFVGPLKAGRLQALPIAWDVVHGAWFDLFTGDPRTPEDWGHWTNRGMNANAQCLFCHTTGYDKGYQPTTDTYDTTWTEIGVGCEACHGPGREHVAAMRADPPRPYTWKTDESDRMLAACGACHARRVERAPWTPGDVFLDRYEPELLDTDAYYPDGQVKEELYELVSFQMSRMYAEGVRCWDCHEPHTLKTRREGNALCLGCHQPHYAEPEHTQHARESTGSRCVSCHMQVTVYMQHDPRHDHSFQRPDPQMTLELGVPNACNACHTDKDAAWAAEHVNAWFPNGDERAKRRAVATAIAQGRAGDPAAVPALLALVRSGGRDGVRRGSAARLLSHFPTSSGVTPALLEALRDEQPLVRAGAAWALGQRPMLTPDVRSGLEGALTDPIRIVRLHAVLALRALDVPSLPAPVAEAWERAAAEWKVSQEMGFDTPEARYNMAIWYTARGQLADAERSYREALQLWPRSIQARHNLAMLFAQQGRLPEAEAEFKTLVAHDPVPQSLFALGLLYGQLGRWKDAADALGRCLAEDPTYPRARYNRALALARAGETKEALDELERAAEDPAMRPEAVMALVDIARQVNDKPRLERWIAEAARLDPNVMENPELAPLLER
jgi:tetratricopeptide (TPR) repeat protein